MTIVDVTEDIKKKLRNSNFAPDFIENCVNSKFLAIEQENPEIVGINFVGGLLNVTGIEVNEKFRGKGLSEKLLDETLEECKKRKISFLSVVKPSNVISIKLHFRISYPPIFTSYYNKTEGKEIVVILPLNKNGHRMVKLMRIFNTRIGNAFFTLLFVILRGLLKNLITFSGSKMSKIDLSYSIRNFEKVQETLKEVKLTTNQIEFVKLNKIKINKKLDNFC